MQVFIQIFINSIVSGLILGLVATGFTYIFKVTNVFHLVHGAIYVTGAYSFLWMYLKFDNLYFAISFAFVIVTLLIWLIEKTVYLPLNKKESNQSISLIASMGLYVVIVNILALLFGNENKTIENLILGSFEINNIIFTKVQIIQTVIGIIVTTIFIIYLKLTNSNLALQSISDNETISKVFGVNTEKERLKVLVIGSLLACIASILKTIEVGIEPHSGMSIALTASVVAILVSRLNIFLILTFAISLTILQNLIEWFLNSQWKDGITFLILLLVILFRTEGIISYNLRKDRT